MIRAPIGGSAYWKEWVSYYETRLQKEWTLIRQPSANPLYDPQYTFDTAKNHLRHALSDYSAGADVSKLGRHFAGMLDAWELSNEMAAQICAQHNLETCRDWTFELRNLNHYNWCFWLVGLALALEIPDSEWTRLLSLIGGEGDDVLLDRVIASRQTVRRIGSTLLHPKPYARLLNAINAPIEQQALLLKDFVDHWYLELSRKGKEALWWYTYGDPDKSPLENGSYFGRWCIEAVAAVKAFGLDDGLCLGHEYYPGDLLRPDRSVMDVERKSSVSRPGWLSRLAKFGKRTG